MNVEKLNKQFKEISNKEIYKVDFKTTSNDLIKVYTNRPDMLYGVTFLVISFEHPFLKSHKGIITNYAEILDYKKEIRKQSEIEGINITKEKIGIRIEGIKGINPLNNEEIGIYVSDFILSDFGTGVKMGVPAHDEVDFEFAKKYNIPIIPVINQITGEIRENASTKNSIVAVIYNPKTDQYLTLNWKELGGRLFIGGSIEENEAVVDCAVREIKEETGYINIQLLRKSNNISHNYYAYNKNKAYKVNMIGLLFELKSEEVEKTNLDETEIGKFTIEWLNKEQVLKEVKDEGHRTLFRNLLDPKPYIGEGIYVNSPLLNEVTNSEEAIKIMNDYLLKNKLGTKITIV